ncbi:MAG: hypothetical protein LBC85_01290 [Fibromonadaceae bacterium]|jgi:hypothetical protein|nr:hypothetical protein [Fibromonadaceae bacterium]
MKKIAAILSFLLLYSCGTHDDDGTESRRFHWELRGVWETTRERPGGGPCQFGDTLCLYAKMVIEFNAITLTGSIAHFENITRNVRLEGYSAIDDISGDNLIHIRARNEWQTPVRYSLWNAAGSVDKILTLENEGMAIEEFRRTGDL